MRVLPGTERRLLATVAEVQRTGRLPSVVAALVRDREIVWSVGRGEVPGTVLDTQYRIGSLSKTFTAVLLLQDAAAGRLDLEETLGDRLPESPWPDRTLRAVLSHTAGLPKEPAGPWWEAHDGGDFAALVQANRGIEAEPAGSVFRYSNLGYGLLGEVASRVGGAPWWDLVRERILIPLGMSRTSYLPEGPHASGASISDLTGELIAEPAADTGAMAPAGQLWSTLGDLAAYANFLLDGDPRVLDWERLVMASRSLSAGCYGLGFRCISGGSGELVGHTGTMPGFMAGLFVDRGRETAAICLANATVGLDTIGTVRRLHAVLEESEPAVGPFWRPAAAPPDDVRDLLGPWFWGQRAFDVSWNGAELAFTERRDSLAWEEFAPAEGGWIGTDGSALEVLREAGAVTRLVCETYEFTRAPTGW